MILSDQHKHMYLQNRNLDLRVGFIKLDYSHTCEHIIDCGLMREHIVHCGHWPSWVGVGCIRMVAEQVKGSKPVGAVPLDICFSCGMRVHAPRLFLCLFLVMVEQKS